MTTFYYDANDLREKAEMGSIQASRTIRGDLLRKKLDKASSLEDMKLLLAEIINDVYPKAPHGFEFASWDDWDDDEENEED